MSIAVMNLVWEKAPYQGNTLLTLLALADWSSDLGESWPGVLTLARKSRQSERNVQMCLKRLSDDKIISVVERYGTSNVYTVNLSKLTGCKEFTPKKTKRGGAKGECKGPEMFAPYTSNTSIEPPTEPLTASQPEINTNEVIATSGVSIHGAVRGRIQELYREKNNCACPWNGREAGMLSRILADNPSWDSAAFLACVDNRFKSEVNHSEPPSMWLGKLLSYKANPLDRFGQVPLAPNGCRDKGWEPQYEKASDRLKRFEEAR